MKLEGIKIGLGITGSFCNFSETKNVISNLKAEGADVYPIISFSLKIKSSILLTSSAEGG